MSDYYTWSQFVAAVTGMLTVDGKRAGIGTFRDSMIRQGVIDLQNAIEGYKLGHETVYQPQDLVKDGKASRGVKPPQSVIQDVWLFQSCPDKDGVPGPRGVRYPTDAWPWSDRFALVNGKVAVNNGRGLFCIDPQGYTFYAYPEVFDRWLLSIHWNGLKLDFKDDDQVPFDEQAAMAVAEFVKAKISREVNHNLAEHDSYMKSFTLAKQQCFIAARDKAGLKKA